LMSTFMEVSRSAKYFIARAEVWSSYVLYASGAAEYE
jgi:hypothetical protein